MFYAILGDTNGNNPQVTGEASLLLARSCFPKDNLGGDSGHEEMDVTYILYAGPEAVLPSSAHNDKYITDFDMLRSMGDHLTTSLSANLGISPLSPGSSSDNDREGDTDGSDVESAASAHVLSAASEVIALFLAVFVLVLA